MQVRGLVQLWICSGHVFSIVGQSGQKGHKLSFLRQYCQYGIVWARRSSVTDSVHTFGGSITSFAKTLQVRCDVVLIEQSQRSNRMHFAQLASFLPPSLKVQLYCGTSLYIPSMCSVVHSVMTCFLIGSVAIGSMCVNLAVAIRFRHLARFRLSQPTLPVFASQHCMPTGPQVTS